MEYVKHFKEVFQSIPDYRTLVLLVFLIENYVVIFQEGDFLTYDIIDLCKDFRKIVLQKNDEYLTSFWKWRRIYCSKDFE